MRLAVIHSLSRHFYRGLTTRGCQHVPAISVPAARYYSDVPQPYKYINVKHDQQTGVSVFEMKKAPVNSLSLDFLTEINIAFEKFENDKTVRGVIISSAVPVFSAGLDIMEMYQPEPERLREFWYNVQEMALRIYYSPKVVLSAIDGPCIAGGCIFAWGSDYRIMSEGKHTMGLNETKLGLAAPTWLADLAVRNMGLRNAEKMLQLGELYPPQDALRLGMIDEICSPGSALNVAQDRIKQWTAIGDSGRVVTKQMLRKDFVESLRKCREQDISEFCGLVMLDGTQNMIKRYVEALKAKSS